MSAPVKPEPFPAALDRFLNDHADSGTGPAHHTAAHVPHKDIFESVWKIVQECGEEERHFNTLQSVYRGVASSWLLATFGGVGYLLFDKDGNVTHPWMAGGICILGALGICLLWMLDLHIYHRLLEAAFKQGLDLERKFAWLPRFRSESQLCTKAHVRPRLALYYFLTTLAPAAVGIGLFYKYGYYGSALLFCVAWGVVVSVLLMKTIRKDEALIPGGAAS
jgi:hypothetical protein